MKSVTSVRATTSDISRTKRSMDTLSTRNVFDTSSKTKICLHVLGQGRSDVRVMRSGSALIEAGFAVSVVDLEIEQNLSTEEEVNCISMQHVVVPDWYTARRFEPWFFVVAVKTFILSILRLIQMHADIYHACELTALPACYIASRLLRKPLIFEIYDLQFPVPYTKIAFWRRVAAHLYDILLPRCAGVIVTSFLHAREICNRYCVPGVTLVRNIPKYQAVQKTDRLRKHLGLSPQTRIALYQGNIQSDRGLEALVHAAPFLEEDIVIVIKGRGREQAQLEALIVDKGVTDRVKVIPFVPFDEMLDWAASADIGLIVHPPDFSLNVQTLLPNKLFEYLMAGLPVLTSEIEAVVDIVKSYDVGQIVSSVEPGAIGMAINAMLADDTALHHMSHNALEAAKNDLNWEKERLQLLRLYEGIVVNSRRNEMQSVTKINAAGTGTQSGDISAKTSSIYTNKFFKMLHASAWKGASRIVPKVLEMIQPTSVIDVGCGTGEFLAAFLEHGIENILGIDGAYVQQNLLAIPEENFMPLDLNRPFTLDRTYDLVVCLEVAEHLRPQSAGDFIASLTRLAPIILFSAAIPYQGGTDHLNEQWPEYWAALFKQHGFVPVDALRWSIWHDREISYWYRQNLLFFCTEEALAGNEKLAGAYKMTNPDALSTVHPEMYLECNTKYLRILRHILIYVSPLWRIKENIKEKMWKNRVRRIV